jgi:hypothetical protein
VEIRQKPGPRIGAPQQAKTKPTKTFCQEVGETFFSTEVVKKQRLFAYFFVAFFGHFMTWGSQKHGGGTQFPEVFRKKVRTCRVFFVGRPLQWYKFKYEIQPHMA